MNNMINKQNNNYKMIIYKKFIYNNNLLKIKLIY